jgi:DNA phosphorothioation-dependent restriction protein DptG
MKKKARTSELQDKMASMERRMKSILKAPMKLRLIAEIELGSDEVKKASTEDLQFLREDVLEAIEECITTAVRVSSVDLQFSVDVRLMADIMSYIRYGGHLP